jgi:hypothetical protein
MKTSILGIELILLALGLGIASLGLPKALPLPAAGRFAFGITATPFVVGTIILFVTFVWPGVPSSLLALAPGLVALPLLWFYRSLIVWLAHRVSYASFRDPVVIVLLIGVLGTGLLIALRIMYFAQEPLGNSDAMQYLQEAKHFAALRSFFDLAGMRGLEDGTLRGDPHGPLWIAWLASALVWETNAAGDFTKTLVRLPFEASFLIFFTSVAAFASAFRSKYYVLAALLACIAIPRLYGTITAGDRDSFRLAALLLLASYLLAHLRPNLSRVTNISAAVIGAAVTAFAVQGHGLALVLVPIMLAAWCVVVLLGRFPLHGALVLLVPVGFGFLIGSLQVIDAYWHTGSLMGDNVFEQDVTKGTAYGDSIGKRNDLRIGDGADPIWRMVLTVARDRGWPSIAAVFVVLSGFVVLLRRMMRGQGLTIVQWRGILLGAWFVAYTLFVLGLFDIGRAHFGAWTIMNIRYSMQWHLAAALIAALGFAFVLARAKTRMPLLAILLAFTLSLGTAILVMRTWEYYPTRAYENVSAILDGLVRPLRPSCRILAEDTGIGFYVERPVIQLYAKSERALLAANTPAKLDQLLSQRGFCVIVIYNGLYIDVAGPTTPFAQLLESKAFKRRDASPWRIYVREGA